MKVIYCGYREWALRILQNLIDQPVGWEIVGVISEGNKMQLPISILSNQPDVILFYGWSWIIPKEIYEKYLCLILHPSPLPKYRGGSPLQHQIMAGEKESAVTILKVGKRIDAGEIYSQTPFSLSGTLDDIFDRIIEVGTDDTIKVLNDIEYGTAKPRKQDDSKATVFKRRKPEESEMEYLSTMTARQIHDFIRALADPYPNAFIRGGDGKKVYITGSHL